MSSYIPYGRQCIKADDIKTVIDVLKSDWLTTGPCVGAFEEAVAKFVGAQYAVAVSSGTAALHSVMYSAGIKASDEVIVPPMTSAATANAVVFQVAIPVFCDVDFDKLLIDPGLIESKINPHCRCFLR